MKRTFAGLAVLAVTIGVASPAFASKPKAHKKPPVSVTTAGAAYTSDVAPANDALSAFNARSKAWTSTTTDAQAESDAQPAITALVTLDSKLVDGPWPKGVQSDIRALVTADGLLIGDLRSLSTINLLNSSTFSATLQRDAAGVSTAVAFVRHDLGLPKATTP